jgi:Uma2 family endonuclease
MKTAAPVSVEEYLRTTYEPDCDYVDGAVIERNFGEPDHSDLQSELVTYFRNRGRKLKTQAFVEQRVQVSETRYRVPDVCVYVGEKPRDQIFRTPPFICIEVLSPEDRVARTQARIDDYFNFGLAYVWVINPSDRRVWAYTTEGSREIKNGILETENPSLRMFLTWPFTVPGKRRLAGASRIVVIDIQELLSQQPTDHKSGHQVGSQCVGMYVLPGNAVAVRVLPDAWQEFFGTMYRNPFVTESCFYTRAPFVRDPRIGGPAP